MSDNTNNHLPPTKGLYGATGLGLLQATKLSRLDANNHAHLMAWLQDVSRGVRKRQFPDFDSLSKDEQHQAEFQCFIEAALKYTIFLTRIDDSGDKLHRESHKGSVNVSEIMEAAVAIYSGMAEAEEAFKEFNKLLGTDSAGVGASNFMNFWWEHVDYEESGSNFRIGPAVYDEDGNINFTVIFYSYDYKVDNWRSLFVESDYESITTTFIGATFMYSPAQWAEYGPDIEQRFAPQVKKSIMTAPLGVG